MCIIHIQTKTLIIFSKACHQVPFSFLSDFNFCLNSKFKCKKLVRSSGHFITLSTLPYDQNTSLVSCKSIPKSQLYPSYLFILKKCLTVVCLQLQHLRVFGSRSAYGIWSYTFSKSLTTTDPTVYRKNDCNNRDYSSVSAGNYYQCFNSYFYFSKYLQQRSLDLPKKICREQVLYIHTASH